MSFAVIFCSLLIVVMSIASIALLLSARRHENRNEQKHHEQMWAAREKAVAALLGPPGERVLHAAVPFEIGGGADVQTYHPASGGTFYVTNDLVGSVARPNDRGPYEMAIATRSDAEWAPTLLSQLAIYTRTDVLNPGDTMDLGDVLPQPTQLVAFVLFEYARLRVRSEEAGLLLCLGLTASELEFARRNGSENLLPLLKEKNVFPYTDPARSSVL